MRIEKISENQIRCTLNKKDLVERQLKISELAYGSEKAKALFRDMMQQASTDFGFEAEDIPLMIEAIPVSKETIILVITKVSDPDEIENRFSKLTGDASEESEEQQESENLIDDDDESFAEEILQCFDQLDQMMDEDNMDEDTFIPLNKSIAETRKKKKSMKKQGGFNDLPKTRVFSFHSLEDIIRLSEHMVYYFNGPNSVYKDSKTGLYYLILFKTSQTPENFDTICQQIAEFGTPERSTYATDDYMSEHFESIIQMDALQILSVM